MQSETPFDPKKHLIQLKGKWYLETKYRIAWFRDAHPNGCISTEIISLDPVMVKATVYDGSGDVLATGHAGAIDKGNAVWSGRALEKSETAAIGRALAHAGFGAQFDTAEPQQRPPSQRSTSTDPTPPARPPRNWMEPDGAADAFERRLKTLVHSALTLAEAQRLLGDKPLTSFRGSDDALRAVQQAHAEFIASEPA